MPKKPTYEELEERVVVLENTKQRLREAEQLLKEEILLRRLMVKESVDGIVVLDTNGKVFETNMRFADMIGYTVQEAYGLHVWDWDDQHTQEEILAMIREVDDTGHHFETGWRRKDGTKVDVELSNNGVIYRGQKLVFCVCRDITERKKAAAERERLITELKTALAEISTLQRILPLCAFCKNIRDDQGYWEEVEVYLHRHAQTNFTHGVCPDCAKIHYPELEI